MKSKSRQLFPSAFAISLLLLLLPVPTYAQVGAIHAGVQNLMVRNAMTTTQCLYLHSDREVYAPADTIWFKAYVRDQEGLQASSLSQTLSVYLVDEQGYIAHRGQFLIKDSDAHGQFTLDHKLPEGRYYLVAHTSWMKNFGEELYFRKQFLIRKEQRDGPQLLLSLDRNMYFPGDSLRAGILCYDELNRDMGGIGFRYELLSGKESYAKGRLETSGEGPAGISHVLPRELPGELQLQLKATHRGERLDTTFRIPVIRDIHLDFFPEGGHRILGLDSRVAFLAQSIDGKVLNVEGEVIQEDGQVLLHTRTAHEGMGSFTLAPENNDRLSFRITDPPGFDSLYPLPPALQSGWALSGENTSKGLKLLIERMETQASIALLTVMVRDRLVFNTQLQVDHAEELEIPAAIIPRGIAVVTLYDGEMIPSAERLFFNGSDIDSRLHMQSEKESYVPRDRVNLRIGSSGNSAASMKGSYSLSIVDQALGLSGDVDEANLRTSFLLSPEIRGQIRNPNYYLQTSDPQVREHLDLLLRTQGWRCYENISGKDWLHEARPPIYQDSYAGTLLKQKFGRLSEPSAGEINVYYGGGNTFIQVDESGRFRFTPEFELQYNSGILLSGTVKGNSNYVTLEMDGEQFNSDLAMSMRLMADSLRKHVDPWQASYLSPGDQYNLGITYHEWIDEVSVVRSGRTPKDEDFEILIEDFVRLHKIEARPEYIESAIDVIGILYNMGIPVDYMPESDVVEHLGWPRAVIGWVVEDSYYGTQYSHVSNFVPRAIRMVTVVKDHETQYFGPNMPQVVVSIRLKNYDPEDPDNSDILSKYEIPRFQVPRTFYQPRYRTERSRQNPMPDLRKTIHWEPDLKLDQNGEASVEFYNGDRYTRVKCILEGITDEGIPVYEEFDYEVSLSGS